MGNRKPFLFYLVIPVIICLSGTLFISRCSFDEPSAPTWNVRFVIPLLNERYTMVDLADDYDELDIQDQEVIFTIDQEIETFEVGDKLYVSGANRETVVPFGALTEDSVAIPVDYVIVESAAIKSGQSTLTIENLNNYPVDFTIIIIDMKQPGGVTPYTLAGQVSANNTESFTTMLDGFVFTPPLYGGQNYIRFSANLIGGNPGDEVTVNFDISELYFSYVTGVLNEMEIAIDSMETEIDIPEQFEDFQIASANLKIAIKVGILMPIQLDLMIEVLDSQSGTYPAPIVVHETIVPTAGAEADTIIIGDVADFINSLPKKILVSGSMKLGDGVISATITDTSSVQGTAIFQAPLTMSLPSESTEMDVDTLEIDEDAIDMIRDNLMELQLFAEIKNHLPAGAEVSIFFARDTALVYTNPDLQIQLVLTPAPTAGDPGVVIAEETSENNILLTKDDLRLFEEPEIYFGVRFVFPGTGSDMVQIRPSDYIDIRSYIAAEVFTEFPEDEEEDEGGGS